MADNVAGKTVVVTGAGSGFGRLAAKMLGERGARIVCADIDLPAAEATARSVGDAGGEAVGVEADVSSLDAMHGVAARAVEAFGGIDVMVNNAGIMPLAFLADHQRAAEAWARCIDINFKGVMNGTIAVYDQMIAQGRGHIVNLSSIFGNQPVTGGAVYGATKAAVNYFSDAIRQEARGKIKVTVVRPSGVSSTGLAKTVVSGAAAAGIVGGNMAEFQAVLAKTAAGTAPPEWHDPEAMAFNSLTPDFIAQAIVHAIDQPWGVAISDITVRAAGDYYVI